ncbi:prion-inhibition and propagation-domain-containing protein [Dactylonectria estremocensis]|uniref:Prion-inhibition and propagation-domain-containing protein n=1 Tax=Dactylonectria estremocensis TaxID=1079267 RepID=A0A9P9DSK1_9HYPO|nr:prion-inhibition and propagation-domain-containing protein [Dactylonectria estremocensis]
MAEVFGTVAGALSVAALFNNCVDCFEYIQLSRHFGRDFERCQLKLDIAKIRLGRWGEAVAINDDPRFATDAPDDRDSRQVQGILEEIELLFQAVQKSSKRYEINARQDDLMRFEDKDMQPVVRGLHGRLGVITRQRQKRTGLLRKAAWALYDGKNFDKLVEQITGFVDDLEKLFPVETTRRKLVELEIEEVDDEPSLMALQDAAVGTDSVLSEAVAEKIEGIAGRNYAKDIKGEEMARVRIGNEWSETALARGTGIADRTANLADSVEAKGTSAVHIGNQYGGRGIFD